MSVGRDVPAAQIQGRTASMQAASSGLTAQGTPTILLMQDTRGKVSC